MGRGQDAHVVSGCVEAVVGSYGPKPYRIVGTDPVLARHQRRRGTDQIELIGRTRPMPPQQRGRSGVIGMIMREQDCPHVAQRASEPLGCAGRFWPAVEHQPAVDENGGLPTNLSRLTGGHARRARAERIRPAVRTAGSEKDQLH